jgi:hypothetical protein
VPPNPVGVIVALVASACSAAAPHNLLEDGNFERADLTFSVHDAPGAWVLRAHEAPDAKVTPQDNAGRGGSRCLHYTRTDDRKRNIHLDQLVPVHPDTIYEVRAWTRSDGKINPLLAVQTLEWKNLANQAAGTNADWRETRFVFHSGRHEQVRFEWFPGASGTLYTGHAGESWLDDVSIVALPDPSPELRQAFALSEIRKGDEIDLRAVERSPIGPAVPLRPITCRDGVLVYDDGSEVALWGVNVQTALSWEWRGRLRRVGIPLEADALKRVTDENLAHLRKMDLDVIRLHLLPSDFTDAVGNLRDSVYLDVLDYVVARCGELGIYVYLTLVNEMGNTHHFEDSFMAEAEREEWLFDPQFIANVERYVSGMMLHENRYTGTPFGKDATIAVFEIMNEPRYPTFGDLESTEQFSGVAANFAQWRKDRGAVAFPNAYFHTYRYETVKSFLTRMHGAIRASQSEKPVVWNLNWPRMINGHEDVFQAVSDSPIDAVSFCCYPGQSDTQHPFWKYPVDLSDRNYLPYLRKCYTDYSCLRWLLGKRFSTKAKLVYEFETMYNHTSHLYPAMAAMFRSLGAQIAPMWQYTLSPVAEFISGSHYLNLHCTPNKAVSFAIAGHVFRETPRLTPYDIAAEGELTLGHGAISVEGNVALWQTPTTYLQSRHTDWRPHGSVKGSVKKIIGCGDSPLVSYAGSGVYFVTVSDRAIELEILPDATYLRPNWQRTKSRGDQLERVCALDGDTPHRMELRLKGWPPSAIVRRLEGDRETQIRSEVEALAFQAKPGRYRITLSAR